MLRNIIVVLGLISFPLSSKEVLIVPHWRGAMHEDLYVAKKNVPFSQYSLYQKLNALLNAQGDELHPTDLSSYERLKSARAIIFENTPDWIGRNWIKLLRNIPKEKLILIGFEPPSVKSRMYAKKLFSHFHKVLTWHDDLVDNKKFIKFNYPVAHPMIPDIVPFSKKKLLTQICGNKRSSHPYELYSERRKVIDFFEKKGGKDFEFYGTGWAKEHLKTWKGVCADKTETLKNYRFSICYENTKNQPGYITEKIFDSFMAGSVPIYWGAPNIVKYVPKKCFIARQDFKTFDELLQYVKNMKEQEYSAYIEHIRAFLQSKQVEQFHQTQFLDAILNAIP